MQAPWISFRIAGFASLRALLKLRRHHVTRARKARALDWNCVTYYLCSPDFELFVFDLHLLLVC